MLLTTNEQKVHDIIRDEIIEDGGMGCMLSTIVKEMGESSKTIRGYLGSLVKKGIVEVNDGDKMQQQPDLYYIVGLEL